MAAAARWWQPCAVSETGYDLIRTDGGVPIKAWTRGVPFEASAEQQLRRAAMLPFIHKWIAVMPDVHEGRGATIGSVIPTHRAIIPAAVGVDIGCGMMAVKTSLRAAELPDDLRPLRAAIERAVPHGRTANGRAGDRGAWHDVPPAAADAWSRLGPRYARIIA
jgi:tRNA-splicing ligase RtcB